MTAATKPLTEQTPVEIDTTLYTLYQENWSLRADKVSARDSVHYAAGDERKYGYRQGDREWALSFEDALAKARGIASSGSYKASQAQRAVERFTEISAALTANVQVQQPLHEEYKRRPWTRGFLVTDGHVHRSMGCSTCFPTTQFTWLVDLSGKAEAEIVALAGERACTVCYPTAPTLRDFEKASPLFTEEEAERNRQREIRAQEKAERLAKKIAKGLTHDGSEFVVVTEEGIYGPDYYNERLRGQHYTRRESFKTEQAAVQWVVAGMASNYRHENTETMIKARQAIIEAVATKHGKTVEQVGLEIDAKVQAKIKRDNRGY